MGDKPPYATAVQTLDLPAEILIEGVARGFERLALSDDRFTRLLDTLQLAADVRLLKEGNLTPDQCAQLVQLSTRTMDQRIADKKVAVQRGLGPKATRIWLWDLLGMLRDHHQEAAAKPA